MRRLTLLEPTGVLGIRMERLLRQYGFEEIKVHKKVINNNVAYTFKESDLIIADIDKTDMDILQLIRQIKETKNLERVGIILISSNVDIKTLKAAIGLGVTDFIIKPFNDELLIDKVHKYFDLTYSINNSIEQDYNLSVEDQPSLTWDRDYAIGIDEIDQEHKRIVENYKVLYQKMRSGDGKEYYVELLEYLENYVSEHFEHEEAFQEKVHYPGIDEHKEIHRTLKKKVLDLVNEHKGKEISNTDLIRINIFLRNWLLHHILIEDAKVGKFLNG